MRGLIASLVLLTQSNALRQCQRSHNTGIRKWTHWIGSTSGLGAGIALPLAVVAANSLRSDRAGDADGEGQGARGHLGRAETGLKANSERSPVSISVCVGVGAGRYRDIQHAISSRRELHLL